VTMLNRPGPDPDELQRASSFGLPLSTPDRPTVEVLERARPAEYAVARQPLSWAQPTRQRCRIVQVAVRGSLHGPRSFRECVVDSGSSGLYKVLGHAGPADD